MPEAATGKLSARQRVEVLVDPGSFVEVMADALTPVTDFGMAARRKPGDGVIVGQGTVDGRPLWVYAQDWSVMAGTVGVAHAEKIAHAIDQARAHGMPVVGLWDSAGARIQEGLEVTKAIGKIFFANSMASGAVPQLSAVMGPCIGVGSYSPALTDVIFMVRGTGQMFITGPAVIKEVLAQDVTMEDLGGAKVHSELSGCVDLIADDDRACLAELRRLLSFLPSSFESPAPRRATGAVPDPSGVAALVPGDLRKPYDVRKVIRQIVDDGDLFELKARFARNMTIGLARLDGRTVGFIANNPQHLAGSIDVDAADKASRFIRFCDAFEIPIVTLVDVPGFLPGLKQEHSGIIRHGAKMLYAYSEATVPKITLYLRKGYGGAKQAMCTHELGADLVLLWPGVELAVMGAEAAVEILHRREIEAATDPAAVRTEKVREFKARFSGPGDALAKGFADAAIDPSETRARLVSGLAALEAKKVERPRRKHDVMPV